MHVAPTQAPQLFSVDSLLCLQSLCKIGKKRWGSASEHARFTSQNMLDIYSFIIYRTKISTKMTQAQAILLHRNVKAVWYSYLYSKGPCFSGPNGNIRRNTNLLPNTAQVHAKNGHAGVLF